MYTARLAVSSNTVTQCFGQDYALYGLISFLNESPTVGVRLYCSQNGSTPSVNDVLTNGILLAPDNGNQLQLQDVNGGERLDFWYMTAVPDGETPTSSWVGVAC